MLDKPGGAARALKAMTAGAAQGQRRIAAPVEEQKRLLAGLKCRRELADQRRRQKTASLYAFAAHIDEPHRGELGCCVTPRQRDTLVAAAREIDHGFERGCRRYQDDRD